ncbi:glyoxalase superfamily protein [Agrobacterium burrii]
MGDAGKHSLSGIGFERTFPIVRIFDEAKAREFYVDFLDFEIDWEHRFGENFPLYMQVSRAGMGLHLSGHHGDATPGSNIFVTMRGVHAFQQELVAKDYRFLKPGVEELPWGDVMEVTDPFGNRIRFCEQKSED